MPSSPRQLVLASTSVYRQELLSRLGYPFTVEAPAIDETPITDETPYQTALRLSELKAKAVAARHPDALIIGSDQVAHGDGQIFGKPGNQARATAQLQQLSGKTIAFVSGLCVYDSAKDYSTTCGVVTKVRFRDLTPETIESYLKREDAYSCAGSAKSEGLGIALIASMACEDPTALVGLPLIALCDLLKTHGLSVI